MRDWDTVELLQCLRIVVASIPCTLTFALSALDWILDTLLLALVLGRWETWWALLWSSAIKRRSARLLAFLSWKTDAELLEDCRSDRWLKPFVCSFSQRLCVNWKVRVPVRGYVLGIDRAASGTRALFSHVKFQLLYEHTVRRLWEETLLIDLALINGYLSNLKLIAPSASDPNLLISVDWQRLFNEVFFAG